MRRLSEWVEVTWKGRSPLRIWQGWRIFRALTLRDVPQVFRDVASPMAAFARIDRAKQLLKGPLPLAASRRMCGFVDQSHFTKVFTRLEGATPGSWRRQAA